MKRLVAGLAIAAAGAVGLGAQEIKSETKVNVDDAKAVVYTGCLATAEGAQFMLENAVAVPLKDSKTETKVDESGIATTTTTTRYILVPGDRVDLRQSVGNKVEVTAILIPAGDDDAEIKTQTKTEVNGKRTQEIETKEKIPQGKTAQLRVMSVKQLSDRCSA